jgi:very-short-patch-repair endonuclease
MNVEAFAASQYGVVSRAQAVERGMSESAVDRRLKSGRWVTVFPSVFRVVGAPVTARQRVMAAALWSGGVVSHETAGRLLRLEAVPKRGLHLTVAKSQAPTHDDVHVHRTSVLPDIDRRWVDAIPCTSATRALIDCASHLDDEALETAFESARRMGLTTVTLLERRARELCGPGRAGSGRVRRLLAVAETRATESRLEVRLARLLRASALPEPVRQYAVGAYRLDFAWPWLWVAAECDGFERHGTRLAWKRDRARIAAIEHSGWRIVHFTWDDITTAPARSVERVALALGAAA